MRTSGRGELQSPRPSSSPCDSSSRRAPVQPALELAERHEDSATAADDPKLTEDVLVEVVAAHAEGGRGLLGAQRKPSRRCPAAQEKLDALPTGALAGDAEGARPLMARAAEDTFDPITVLRARDQRRVAYIVIGALGRVIQGSDELTDGIDIVPSTREENIRKLGLALEDLNARRTDGRKLALDESLTSERCSSSRPTPAN